MLNANSLHAVNNAKFSQRFRRPLYESYCFANIPQTITFLLTGTGECALPRDVFGSLPTRYSKVILFFVDAFGWRFFAQYADKYPLLKTFLTQGVVSKMTSQFPSTTAAHATCIHTGLNVGQSGVYEWYYYEPLLDELISPLLFSYAGDRVSDTLKRDHVSPDALLPQQTLYQTLKAHGVASYIFQHRNYTPSTFSDVVFRGATATPYETINEALTTLSTLVLTNKTVPAYYFLYFDQIDTAGHRYGPGSQQFDQAVDLFWTSMQQLLYTQLHGKVRDTLLIITADHGQIEVDPKTTFYLNREIPDIERYLLTNHKGKPLVPAGSAQDMFLHVQDEYVDELIALLRTRLAGKAEIYRTQELLDQHFFGLEVPSATFSGRVGNVVILTYQHETVWWREPGKFAMVFAGNHGGLTPEEMEIPFMLLPL